jgi:hypothetical protein
MKKLRVAIVMAVAGLLRVPVRLRIEEYWWGIPKAASTGLRHGPGNRGGGGQVGDPARQIIPGPIDPKSADRFPLRTGPDGVNFVEGRMIPVREYRPE